MGDSILDRDLGIEFLVDLMKFHKVKFYEKLQESSSSNVLLSNILANLLENWNIKIYVNILLIPFYCYH